jgi:FkbM family methyltransferase
MIRSLIRNLGIDIVRYPIRYPKNEISVINEWRVNTAKLILHNKIDLVIDVGANEGFYVEELRQNGYLGKVVSFEPLDDAFSILKMKADKDELWDTHQLAIGDYVGDALINVSGNSQSSSLLAMNELHLKNAPESRYIRQEKIQVDTLDNLFSQFESYRNIYIKIDVQGFGKQVMAGLRENLSKVKGLQVEMSFEPLYEDEETFFDQSSFLLSAGFKLKSIEPGFFDPSSGQLLQADGVWYR